MRRCVFAGESQYNMVTIKKKQQPDIPYIGNELVQIVNVKSPLRINVVDSRYLKLQGTRNFSLR